MNVCIYRIPRNESIVFPASHCPNCGNNLAPRDLAPLFSYLVLKGRCRYCKSPIHWRYPLVELLTGFLFIALYCSLGLNLLLLKYLLLACFLVAISFIDLEHYIIPNKLVIALLGSGIVMGLLTREHSLVSVLLGMFVPFAALMALALISNGGMGGGDIKLAGVTGLFLGWPQSIVALILSCCIAGIASLIMLALKVKKRKDPIPFGPYYAAGIMISIFWGKPLLELYLAYSGF
ncbi:MAG: Type 4 prepilin-like proteins leader peptide-processing enzyme PilD [Desulfotomaculum sp. 46_296]|nr:MAG: Type 4 prepilin-like proteins leader peptide-processing enzyme PilD [Desulfotomaculum sp. 46_296]